MENITIRSILEDKREEFKEKKAYKLTEDIREDIIRVVEKSLACGDINKGFTEYMCLECGGSIKVGFTCKSKFCAECGRLYILKWVEKQQKNMLRFIHRRLKGVNLIVAP